MKKNDTVVVDAATESTTRTGTSSSGVQNTTMGDLTKEAADKDDKEKQNQRRHRVVLEQNYVRGKLKELNARCMVSETSILHFLANHPLEYQRAFLSITKR
jgi:hypothetical protein